MNISAGVIEWLCGLNGRIKCVKKYYYLIPLPIEKFLFPCISFSVAPSVPVCELHGYTYVGDDVTLTCHSSQGVPAPIYSWNRDNDAAPLRPNSFVAGRTL